MLITTAEIFMPGNAAKYAPDAAGNQATRLNLVDQPRMTANVPLVT